MLEILVALGIIQSHHIWVDVKRIEEALQNVLVCVDMVFLHFSYMHIVLNHTEMMLHWP